jgi:hypothetical protein
MPSHENSLGKQLIPNEDGQSISELGQNGGWNFNWIKAWAVVENMKRYDVPPCKLSL